MTRKMRIDMEMTEFQELIQDAPCFVSMERGELVAYAYAMFAAGTKADSENTKLREMVRSVLVLRHDPVYKWLDATFAEVFGKSFTEQAQELGVEVDG